MRSIASQRKGEREERFDPVHLEQAFLKFNEASARLQAKYDALLLETQKLREQLSEKEREIQRATKLATLGETAAALAHEIRNPLGSMKLFLSLLRQDLDDRPDLLETVGQLEQSVTTLNHVVSNILQFSKDRKLMRLPVNLHAIVQEQASLVTKSHRALSVKLLLEANPFLLGDEHALRQVFHNLLLNAAQATKGAGEVSILTHNGDDDELLVEVRDNGPGVPDALSPRIFEPFVTSREEGTGLGLAIVRQIIEAHSGEIAFANGFGVAKQTTFFIRLRRSGG